MRCTKGDTGEVPDPAGIIGGDFGFDASPGNNNAPLHGTGSHTPLNDNLLFTRSDLPGNKWSSIAELTRAHEEHIDSRRRVLTGLFDVPPPEPLILLGEFEGGDIRRPMVAKVDVDPLATIEGHPDWTTGQELIDSLDSDPNVFRDEFNGNRWQGSGARWDECPPSVLDCPYRQAVEAPENATGCVQCETELRPEDDHFHILYERSVLTMCGECWSKGPLPEDDRTLGEKVGA